MWFSKRKSGYKPNTSTRYVNQEYFDNKRKLPELYEEQRNCCGCSACYSICPVKAIIMQPDDEGFLYPTVDAGKCICCYKCLSVCCFKEGQRAKYCFCYKEKEV